MQSGISFIIITIFKWYNVSSVSIEEHIIIIFIYLGQIREKVKKFLVTGGAGFIGSYLVDALLKKNENVTVFDNLSSSNQYMISNSMKGPNYSLIKADMLDEISLLEAIKECNIVFHLAGNSDISLGTSDTKIDYQQNLLATYNLLEAMRNSTSCKRIIFASTSTVYGEAKKMPTPEDYSPLMPISLYGGCKLASEILISTYCHMFNMSGVAVRLANVVGPNATHGVIYDFIHKLSSDTESLEILGDGTQTKSYLYIDDCINALMLAATQSIGTFQPFNVGSNDTINTIDIANIVINQLKLENVKVRLTYGVEGRGWLGDVKQMLLDCSKINELGWRAKRNSREAITFAVHGILSRLQRNTVNTFEIDNNRISIYGSSPVHKSKQQE